MRTLLSFLLATSLTISLFTSCKEHANADLMAKVDTLAINLEEAKAVFQRIDTAQANAIIAANSESLKFIQQNFKDTATKEQAIFLSDVYAVKRSMKKLLKSRADVEKDLSYSKKQLNDFKADLESRTIDREHFDIHYSTESAAVANLMETIHNLENWYTSSSKKYEAMKPEVEKFIKEIEA